MKISLATERREKISESLPSIFSYETIISNMMNDNIVKSFDILAINQFQRSNYFDGPTKLLSDLYVAKFLDISVKPSFPCG